MVCVPCIVIPLLLWVFHKWIQPALIKFGLWPFGKKSVALQPGAVADDPPKGVDANSKEYMFIKEIIKDNPVAVFSKTTCSYSRMAKEVLDKTGVNYHVEEIDGREDCDRLQDIFEKLTPARTVPRVFVGGRCVGGGSETWTFHNQGRLVPLMTEAGATFTDKKED